MRAGHTAWNFFMQSQWSLRPARACPGLHLWPLGDSTRRNKSREELAQVRFMSAA